MSKAGDRLRAEAVSRSQGPWAGKLTKIGMWLQAADWLDENVSDQQAVGRPTVEQFAYALLRESTEGNGHPPRQPWADQSKIIQNLWLKKARKLQTFIDREVQRGNS